MAMLPFCGYNMGDYLAHWLRDARQRSKHPPKIFMVNWFRKDGEGNFLWPGYGENLRVLKWMLDRIHGRVSAEKTPVGGVPKIADLDLGGLEISADQLREDFAIKPDEWKIEMESAAEFFDKIGATMPKLLREKHQHLASALGGNSR